MAVLKGLLTDAQITGYRGEIDFYYQRGTLVARSWPKKRSIPPSESELENRRFFGAVNTMIREKSPASKEEWRRYVRGTTIAWTDPIRWYTHQDNPEHHIPPNITFSRLQWSIVGPPYNVRLEWTFDNFPWQPDDALILLYAASYDQFPPIRWEEVGYKCRRRSLVDKKFAPQYSAIETATSVNEIGDGSKCEALITLPEPYTQIVFTVATERRPRVNCSIVPLRRIGLRWKS